MSNFLNLSIEERMKHPFMGTFTISTLVANWKFIIAATTGDENIHSRIAIMNGLIAETRIWPSLMVPASIALCATIAIPLFNFIYTIGCHYLETKADTRKSITKFYNHADAKEVNQTKGKLIDRAKGNLQNISAELDRLKYGFLANPALSIKAATDRMTESHLTISKSIDDILNDLEAAKSNDITIAKNRYNELTGKKPDIS